MASRATAQQAVEILKVYQLRRENATIYKLVQCLQQEVSDLHDANKNIRNEIEQMQTHSETFNGLTSNNNDRIERLASKIDSLTYKSDRFDAYLTKSTNDKAKQHDETQSAHALLDSKIDVLEARVEGCDKGQKELYTAVTKQIASLQEKIAQDSKTSHNPLTEGKLRELQDDLAKLPVTTQHANLLSRVSESIVGPQANDAGLTFSQMVTNYQQIQNESEAAFLSIPTEPMAPAVTLTNDDRGHNLASMPGSHADTFTQPNDIDLDEIIDSTGHAESDSTLTTLNDSFVMLPLHSLQNEEPLDQPTVQQKSVDSVIDNRKGCDPVCEGEQGPSGSQQDVTPFIMQPSGSPTVSRDVGITTSRDIPSNHPIRAVIFNTTAMTKQSTVGNVATETTKQAEPMTNEKKTKNKTSNTNPAAPLRRSQRLVEKSQGQIQYDPIQLAVAVDQTKTPGGQNLMVDTKKEAAPQPKKRQEVPKQLSKHAGDCKADKLDFLSRTPDASIIRRDVRRDPMVERIALPSSPLQRKQTLIQSNRLLLKPRPRPRSANAERPVPSPYNPRPRLIPCKRNIDLSDCGWTSDMDVYLPPPKKQAISEPKIIQHQAPVSVPLQKGREKSVAPPVKMSILSTSTEEDRRFETW